MLRYRNGIRRHPIGNAAVVDRTATYSCPAGLHSRSEYRRQTWRDPTALVREDRSRPQCSRRSTAALHPLLLFANTVARVSPFCGHAFHGPVRRHSSLLRRKNQNSCRMCAGKINILSWIDPAKLPIDVASFRRYTVHVSAKRQHLSTFRRWTKLCLGKLLPGEGL